jgi:hypothetical protein
MKKLIATLSLIAVSFTANLYSQETSASEKEKEQPLVKIATLSTVEANQEFQQNVRVMQAARQYAIQLQQKIDESTDETEKDELKKKLEESMTELNENNKKMIKNYGFSLNRNYVLVVEKAHIYMQVTPEEAAKVEAKLTEEKSTEAKE